MSLSSISLHPTPIHTSSHLRDHSRPSWRPWNLAPFPSVHLSSWKDRSFFWWWMNIIVSLWCSKSCENKVWALEISEPLDNQCCIRPVSYEKATAITTVIWWRLWRESLSIKINLKDYCLILDIEHLVKSGTETRAVHFVHFLKLQVSPVNKVETWNHASNLGWLKLKIR